MVRKEKGIRGLTESIVRGQVELTSYNAEIITQCALMAFRGDCKGSLRDSITLIIHGFAKMFSPDQVYCLDEKKIEQLIIVTDSEDIFEALAKIADKELNKPKVSSS